MGIGRLGLKKGIHRKTQITCSYCGASFKSWQPKKFCSRKCYWASMKGKEFPNRETSGQARKRMIGKNNPMWKGGDSDSERRNSKYKKWRIDVFKRDGFKCQKCGYYSGCGEKRRDLNAHHKVPWIESFELRYEVSNGITLCVPCHIKEHTDQN